MTEQNEPIQINRRPYLWLKNSRKRRNFLWGGASSSKSHTIAQFLVFDLFSQLEGVGILCIRKTRPAAKTSCWRLLNHYVERGRIYHKPNLSDLTLTSPRRSFIMCDGLDNIGKKKSIEGINFVWAEELAGMSSDTRITANEFRILSTIARNTPHPSRPNQIFASFNPVDPISNAWIEAITLRGDTSTTQLLHLNHVDNPFLSQEEFDEIERNAEEDPQFDRIYRKGLWGLIKGKIYDNWDIVQQMPKEYEQRVWGLDFGFINPSALVEIRIIGNDVYVQEHLYEKGLTTPDLSERMADILPPGESYHEQIVADAAEPDRIQELRNAGYNIFESNKGQGSVNYGIQTVQSFRLHILYSSTNVIEEIQGYHWIMDADEKVKQPPKPCKTKDHTLDGLRYALDKVRRRVKSGVHIIQEGTGESEELPKTREEMLAQRYQPPEERDMEEVEDPIFDDNLWTEL